MYIRMGNGCLWQQNLYKRTWWGLRGETWTLRNMRRRFNVFQLSTVSRMLPENFWMFWWPSMHLVCAINFPNFPKFVILTLEKNFATPYLCCLYYYFFHSFYRIPACDRARVQDDQYHPSNSLRKIVFSCIYAVHNNEFCFWFALWYRYYFTFQFYEKFCEFLSCTANIYSHDADFSCIVFPTILWLIFWHDFWL